MPDNSTTALPQGDLRLLRHRAAQSLLASRELARLAYLGRDGEPRAVPMGFLWDGEALVMVSFDGASKIRDLQRHPTVAVTIDRSSPPPEVLLLRGDVEVTLVDGVLPEYELMQRRYLGEEAGEAAVRQAHRPGVRMARLTLRPRWVGVIDFQERMPGALVR